MKTENKTTHTPGPWFIWTKRAKNHNRVIEGPYGTVVAEACDMNRDDLDAQVDANGRLIAAAPELLAALKMIVESEKYPEFNIAAPWYVAGLAAIAKAEGK